MNRKLPWHQRIVRKVTRHVPLQRAMKPSPLSLFSIFNLLGCLSALLSDSYAVALVLAMASAGAVVCRFRKPSNPGIAEAGCSF